MSYEHGAGACISCGARSLKSTKIGNATICVRCVLDHAAKEATLIVQTKRLRELRQIFWWQVSLTLVAVAALAAHVWMLIEEGS